MLKLRVLEGLRIYTILYCCKKNIEDIAAAVLDTAVNMSSQIHPATTLKISRQTVAWDPA
jgi:hypothetical protein